MIDNVRQAEIEFVVRGCAWRGNLLLRSEDSQSNVWNACEILTGAPDTGTHHYHRRGFKIEEGHCQRVTASSVPLPFLLTHIC